MNATLTQTVESPSSDFVEFGKACREYTPYGALEMCKKSPHIDTLIVWAAHWIRQGGHPHVKIMSNANSRGS